ncbi:MAG: hypothetical protein K2Y29_03705, partial [Beijerinckiaceae bacterium]|nr:hypothetical protein [Beijerinckiaceae bacterium]
MKKKLRAGAQIAAFAAVGAAGFASAGAAQAQALFELRTWSGPRYYDEAPRVYREAPPRYMDRGLEHGFERGALPRRAVRSIIERQGYEVIGPIQLNGEVYIVPVEDMRGRVRRLVVDARDGEIIDRAGPGGPPRPPANMGRARERYASAPDASPLPPLPLESSSRWRGYESRPVPPPPAIPRERIARGAPDAGYGLGERYGDRDDYQVEPGIGPVPPPPPAPGAGERRWN